MEPHAFAYLDDIIVIGAREVRAPSRSKAALKSVRVQVLPKETSVLGYLISEEGIRTRATGVSGPPRRIGKYQLLAQSDEEYAQRRNPFRSHCPHGHLATVGESPPESRVTV